jgi:hypothetical protein
MIAKIAIPGIIAIFVGEVANPTKDPNTPQTTYKSLAQPCPFNIPIPLITVIANPINIMAYCKETGSGLLDITSLTTGLFKLDKLMNTERTPVTIKNQAITVTDFGLFPIFFLFFKILKWLVLVGLPTSKTGGGSLILFERSLFNPASSPSSYYKKKQKVYKNSSAMPHLAS